MKNRLISPLYIEQPTLLGLVIKHQKSFINSITATPISAHNPNPAYCSDPTVLSRYCIAPRVFAQFPTEPPVELASIGTQAPS